MKVIASSIAWKFRPRVALRGFLFFVALTSLLTASRAFALPNDIHLHFLYEGKSAEAVKKQQKNFRLLTTEYGLAVTEPVLSPAETLGIAGFDLGVEITLVDIPELKEHWRRAIEDERPDNELFITRIRLRKGLPFSLELDGSVGFIHNSSAVIGNIGLKWALNEGFRYFPDLAVRGSVNRVFSSRDLDLFTVAVDFWISKQFSILGMFTLTPYAGYSLMYLRGNSQVLDPTPKNFSDNESVRTGNFVFETENLIAHRFFFGLRIVWFIMSFTFEGMFAFPSEGKDPATGEGPENISAFNMKVSFFF